MYYYLRKNFNSNLAYFDQYLVTNYGYV